MNIRLSLAKRKDARDIANMARTLIEHGLPWSWNERRIVHCLANPDCVVITARDARKLVGFAVMEFLDDRAHLSLLAVQPGYQRMGVGRGLLEWLHSSAIRYGLCRVYRPENHRPYRIAEELLRITEASRSSGRQ